MPSEHLLEQEEIERIFFGFTLQAQKQLSATLNKPQKKVIVISGPTACGKTQFAIDLAKRIGGEIISADSMQVYRGMDIGTAKATIQDCQEISHHLLDIRDVTEPFNVVDFYYEARHCCQFIQARDRVPIVVGGSGFYIHSFLYGPPEGPPSIQELRKGLEEEIEILGCDALYDRLKALDPQYAMTITKNDKHKIVRALEIIALTGKKVSKLPWRTRRAASSYDFHCWFLYRPRDHLYKLIDARCEKMVEEGFLHEVERLIDQGLLSNTSAAGAIGYRQAIDYLQSSRSIGELELFMREFKKASHRYAKRQFTWFRREKLFRWVNMDAHDPGVIVDLIMQEYDSR